MPHECDHRRRELQNWVTSAANVDVTNMVPASVDASFRRYFRVCDGTASYIAMDAPPELENSAPFVEVAGYLRDAGLHCPRVLHADLERGFLLLTDLGNRQYLEVLQAEPARTDELYADALAALVLMQHAGTKVQSQLPPYDRALLEREMSLFSDWLCRQQLGIRFSAADERAWRATVAWLVDAALAQPRVFVHRDYHSRNLMVCATGNPGILDFQDAVEGPYTYDLVSLLKDCYLRLPPATVLRWAERCLAELQPNLPAPVGLPQFRQDFEAMGVQRHLKAAGIFARLNLRDGKPAYLEDVPRTLGYIVELAERYPQLAFLDELIRTRCLPALDAAP